MKPFNINTIFPEILLILWVTHVESTPYLDTDSDVNWNPDGNPKLNSVGRLVGLTHGVAVGLDSEVLTNLEAPQPLNDEGTHQPKENNIQQDGECSNGASKSL